MSKYLELSLADLDFFFLLQKVLPPYLLQLLKLNLPQNYQQCSLDMWCNFRDFSIFKLIHLLIYCNVIKYNNKQKGVLSIKISEKHE